MQRSLLGNQPVLSVTPVQNAAGDGIGTADVVFSTSGQVLLAVIAQLSLSSGERPNQLAAGKQLTVIFNGTSSLSISPTQSSSSSPASSSTPAPSKSSPSRRHVVVVLAVTLPILFLLLLLLFCVVRTQRVSHRHWIDRFTAIWTNRLSTRETISSFGNLDVEAGSMASEYPAPETRQVPFAVRWEQKLRMLVDEVVVEEPPPVYVESPDSKKYTRKHDRAPFVPR
ncbi:hypothetical protein B0H14DRAFT_2705530 [Mycena olivaceomarginata]|nr:hypothetical protein B0H14DRAFT_2705530 [Mycena olivaceomarginata]